MAEPAVWHQPHARVELWVELILVPGVVHREDLAHPLAVAQHGLAAVVQKQHSAIAAVEIDTLKRGEGIMHFFEHLRRGHPIAGRVFTHIHTLGADRAYAVRVVVDQAERR